MVVGRLGSASTIKWDKEMQSIKINQTLIGDHHPAYIVAEVGINHNGDMELAKRMIESAAECGANAVKFQNYITEDFISNSDLIHSYKEGAAVKTESQYEMFKRYELNFDHLKQLALHCEKVGVEFFSTPTSQAGVDVLSKLGVRILKNGSDYLGDFSLLRAMAKTGLPTVISTGMATLSEIDDAVREFKSAGGKEIVILHCTSLYPTPPEHVHLRKISALKSCFQVPVGFSDHSDGPMCAIGAVVLGACMIEKHFTIDKSLVGPDHVFSADPKELKTMVDGIRELEKAMGQSRIGPTEPEQACRDNYRLSCVAARELPAGHVLQEADIKFQRPGNGVPPKLRNYIVKRTLSNSVEKGKIIELEDLR